MIYIFLVLGLYDCHTKTLDLDDYFWTIRDNMKISYLAFIQVLNYSFILENLSYDTKVS